MYQTLRTSGEAPSIIANISNPPSRQFAARVVIAFSQIWNATRSGLAMPRGGGRRVSPLRSSYGAPMTIWAYDAIRSSSKPWHTTFCCRDHMLALGRSQSGSQARKVPNQLLDCATAIPPSGTVEEEGGF